ncbi:uncharacterized protein [Chlorocebus sabaeus]|uniref:uncharacterized protein isoform X2 n=1 Tax=Chlorocebus sabaeus TaxID=60711 RepID=UPI003BF94ED4
MWANASELSPTRTQIMPGMDHFLYGLSDEMKQAHREQLFTISHKKLLAMSDRYLGTGKSTHGLAILRPENPKIAKDPSWIIRARKESHHASSSWPLDSDFPNSLFLGSPLPPHSSPPPFLRHSCGLLQPRAKRQKRCPYRRWAHEGSRAVTPAPMSTLARVIREFQIRSQQGPWLGLDEKLAIRFFKPPPWWF